MSGLMAVKLLERNMTMAKLIYVMGASGAGKDSLLNYARKHSSDNSNYVFAHRYITRPADASGENHIALTVEEFQQRASNDCFTMLWKSHGNEYAIGAEIEHWLQQGLNVVVNGSRAYFNSAVELFPSLVPVLITADKELLLARLTKRGRENTAAIEKRLQQTESLECMVEHPALVVIENNGELALAGNEFIQLLKNIDSEQSPLCQGSKQSPELSF